MSRKKHPEHVNHERWLVSYADFITLLFAFFVVMFASSQKDKGAAAQVSESVRDALDHGQISSVVSTMLGRGKYEAKQAPLTKIPTKDHENQPPPSPETHAPDLVPYLKALQKGLEKELKRTHDGKGSNTLVLTGLHADCCVRHTCADGFFRGYETLVAEDAVESFTELAYRTGLQYVKYWYLTDVLPTKKIVRLF